MAAPFQPSSRLSAVYRTCSFLWSIRVSRSCFREDSKKLCIRCRIWCCHSITIWSYICLMIVQSYCRQVHDHIWAEPWRTIICLTLVRWVQWIHYLTTCKSQMTKRHVSATQLYHCFDQPATYCRQQSFPVACHCRRPKHYNWTLASVSRWTATTLTSIRWLDGRISESLIDEQVKKYTHSYKKIIVAERIIVENDRFQQSLGKTMYKLLTHR